MVTHATVLSIFSVWVGASLKVPDLSKLEIALERAGAELPFARAACTYQWEGSMVTSDQIAERVPNCPDCAVLYDMAHAAREEELGRRAAA